MAETSSILEDSTLLSTFDRYLYCVETALALTGGLGVMALIVLAVTSVGGRNFLNQPIPGYVDWIEQAMPLIACIGISYCQGLGGHIRMNMFIGRLRGRVLWTAAFVGTLLILALIVLLIRGSWAHFERSFDWTAPYWSRDSSLDLRLPLWPAKLLVPVALAVLGLRLSLQLWGYGRAFLSKSEQPVAVPLIEDVSTVAAREARSVSDGEGRAVFDRN